MMAAQDDKPLLDLSDGHTGETSFWAGSLESPDTAISGLLSIPTATSSERAPAVVVSHGSAGMGTYWPRLYTAELHSIGIATFFVDHFTSRGVRETATDQNRVSRFQMGQDDFHALRLLRTHPLIDNDKIGVMGFSKGGVVALETAIFTAYADFWNAGLKFRFHIAMYPGCAWQVEQIGRNTAPILLLVGDKDDWAPAAACIEYADRIRAAGVPIEVRCYANALHAWDGPDSAAPKWLKDTIAFRNCRFFVREDGTWIDRNDGNRLLT